MNKVIYVLLCALCACANGPPGRYPLPVYNTCDLDEDLEVDISGNIVHGISQCAICARLETVYNDTADELGCEDPFPFTGCPIDQGLTDCLVWQVDDHAEFIQASTSCEELTLRTGLRNNWTGFECGDDCSWTDGYAVPLRDAVEQPPQPDYGGPASEQTACCPGTPYQLRHVCSWWCEGRDSCGGVSECEALYEETL